MNTKQRIAFIAPLIIIAVMYPFFYYLPKVFEPRLGWYLGLVVYWLVWGGAFSWWLIGGESIRELIRPQKLDLKIFLLVLFPLLMSALYKLVPGMEYDKPNLWIFLLLISTNVGNGFFEEVFWRGVYLSLFPDRPWIQIVWSGIFFALWHYLPGSVFSDGNVLGLMVGSGMMGLYLGFLAKKTGSIWWTILMHTIGGFIMIL